MIGKNGVVKGDVFANKLIISGKLIGVTECKVIEITPHGRLEGSVLADELVIERKGVLVGESKTRENMEQKLDALSQKV